MTRSRPIRRLRDHAHDDGGFTLVEVTVTAALATVVLLAILMSADLFGSNVSQADRRSDRQEQTRSALREIVAQLRDARIPTGQTTPLAAAPLPSRNNLVFATRLKTTDAVTAQPGWIRYCTTTASGSGDLLVGRRSDPTYSSPGACSLSNGTGWTYARLLARLTDTSRVFDYATGSCVGASCSPSLAAGVPAITSVGVGLSVDVSFGSSSTSIPYLLRGAVALRNRTP